MKNRKFWLFSLILIIGVCILGMKETNVFASGIKVEFDYNLSRPLRFLDEELLDDLIDETVYVDAGEIASPSTQISNKHYVFNHYDFTWTVEGKSVNIENYVIQKDTTFEGMWTPKNYTAHYNYPTSVDAQDITNYKSVDVYNIESPIRYYRPDFDKNNYRFNSWHLSEDLDITTLRTATEKYEWGDIYLYANFTPIEFNINYHIDDKTQNIYNKTIYNCESVSFELQNPQKEGYTFKGWYLDEDFETPCVQINQGMSGDIDLYPKWEVKTYKVTFLFEDKDTQVVVAEHGASAQKPQIKKSIFHIVSYDKSLDNITEDTTIKVKLINIWYIYVIVLVVILASIAVAIIFKCKKNKQVRKLRYIYQSNFHSKKVR